MGSSTDRIRLEESWKRALRKEFDRGYMKRLREFLVREIASGKPVLPPSRLIFRALDLCPLPSVKVVIIGQDPYHQRGQAHGLCFSVPNGVAPPPSLLNIFQEINSDLGTEEGREIRRGRGCLEGWTRQGVLLLNSVLTVLEKRAGSHQAQGWERFTDAVVGAVNSQLDGVVFLLWGGKAREKGMLVDRSRHHVLEAAHPSPLSASSGFFGCRHFSKTNQILDNAGKAPIDWFDVQ